MTVPGEIRSSLLARVLASLLAATAVACTSPEPALVVGGKNFTEQRILGELVAQAAERAGLPVERRLDLGGTFVCDAALRSGQIDVYVEYTGTALLAVLKEDVARKGEPGSGTPDAVLTRVREAYAPEGLRWTAPLGFDNTFALVVPGDVEARTISDALPAAREWEAGFGYEFQQRADGYPALRETYGLTFASVHTMDLGLLYQALLGGQVDLVVGNATDAAIARFDLRVLEDDRSVFPPYDAVPVVREHALARHPGLGAVLDGLGGRIDVAAMRRLNEAVDTDHRSPADVVREFLGR